LETGKKNDYVLLTDSTMRASQAESSLATDWTEIKLHAENVTHYYEKYQKN